MEVYGGLNTGGYPAIVVFEGTAERPIYWLKPHKKTGIDCFAFHTNMDISQDIRVHSYVWQLLDAATGEPMDHVIFEP